MAYSFGSLVGPILGGQLYDLFNWTVTCDIFATISLIFSVVYLCSIVVPGFRSKDKITFEPIATAEPKTEEPGTPEIGGRKQKKIDSKCRESQDYFVPEKSRNI